MNFDAIFVINLGNRHEFCINFDRFWFHFQLKFLHNNPTCVTVRLRHYSRAPILVDVFCWQTGQGEPHDGPKRALKSASEEQTARYCTLVLRK